MAAVLNAFVLAVYARIYHKWHYPGLKSETKMWKWVVDDGKDGEAGKC